MNGKKGLIGALIALVAVIAIAGAAYGALAPNSSNQTVNTNQGESTSAVSSSQVSSQSEDISSAAAAGSVAGVDSSYPILPDFTVLDLEGNTVTLSSMQGKPTVVGYWATWCPPCNAEAPTIQKLYEEYGDRVNFMMVDVTDGEKETEEGVLAWYKEKGYTYPVYLDPTLEAAAAGQARYLPTTFVLDAEGNTVFAAAGVLEEKMGRELFDSLL